ncbi:PagP-like outer membrane protein [Burkholderia phage BcepIL02]|uniref:PagP-like outer membrane protein n=1 Tax=Burkholderia phage BcepIL02 TaxID=2886898 RepID=C5IHL3_9CAUD|nr:antimicrobial peptide resistance and lipid A acylation protein PagP [Burkholderia phage BcepIL02]ACR15015.1 PagP-like outer membrane protein [Burkholderia phage BcepIL02]
MRKVICAAVAALAATAAHADTGVLIFGKSHHFNTHGRAYNELNVGGGVEWSPEGSGWLVGGFALKDSLSRLGAAAYGGYRVRCELGGGFHVEATVRAGLLKDADYIGPAALPAIGIGYRNVTVEATYIPAIGGNKVPAAVVWARINF